MVLACTASLKVPVTVVFTGTPVAPDAGVVLVTTGAVGAAAVVNDQFNGAVMAMPEVLSALTVAV